MLKQPNLEQPELEQPDPQAWQVTDTRMAFHNQWVKVELDNVLLPNGDAYEYTRLAVAGNRAGVGLVGFDKSRTQMLMVREYRHGVGKVLWQFPAGLSESGEDLATAVLRELREETGYAPAHSGDNSGQDEPLRYLGTTLDTPPLGPLRSHIFAAWNLELVDDAPQRDATEFMTIHWKPVEWVKEAARSGEIEDRFVVCALAYLMLNGLI